MSPHLPPSLGKDSGEPHKSNLFPIEWTQRGSECTYIVRKIYPGSCVDVNGVSVLGALNFILFPGMSVGKDDNILLTTRQKIIKSSHGALEQAESLTGTKLFNEKINDNNNTCSMPIPNEKNTSF